MQQQININTMDIYNIPIGVLLTEFEIEPRCNYSGSDTWLVIYDNFNGKYIQDKDIGYSGRSYVRASNLSECIKIINKLKGENKL